MENETMKTFVARISQASKTELVVIMYEIILADIAAAKENYSRGDETLFIKDLKHGGRFLNELMATLNYQHTVSFQLMSLYIYINKLLVSAMYQKSTDTLEDAEAVLQILIEGFRGICKEDLCGPVMQNTQQLYAGLTYGKGVLNETYIDPNQQSRGFKA